MDKKCKMKKQKEKQVLVDSDQNDLDKKCSPVVVKDSSVFRLGECFDSYEDLLARLASHSKQSKVHYWRRDSRTVRGAYMKTTRPLEPKLVYYYVKYACVFGGQKFLPRGKGQRQSMTMRTDCPAHIMVRASKSGSQLEVISVCNTHNHPISEELYKSLPQDRKLEPSVKEEVLNLLKLGFEHKYVLEYVHHATGKTLTNKDLFNLGAGEKKPRPANRTKRKAIESAIKSHNEHFKSEPKEICESEEEGAIAVENLSAESLLEPTVEVLFEEENPNMNESKGIVEYFFPGDMNTLHMIDGEEITDTSIVIEDMGIMSTSPDATITPTDSSQQLPGETLSQSSDMFQHDVTTESAAFMVDSVSNTMAMNKFKLKLVNIDSNGKYLIQQIPDTNKNTLLNNISDVTVDQIDLNNIVVLRDSLQESDGQLVQMYKLNDDNEILNTNNERGLRTDQDRLDDYITYEASADDDFVSFSTSASIVDDVKNMVVDSVIQDDCMAMLFRNDIPSSLNIQLDQMCESCGRTGLLIRNDIQQLKREKEKIEREVRLLEKKRDLLRNEIRDSSEGGDWNCILDAAYEGPVQYILVDQ